MDDFRRSPAGRLAGKVACITGAASGIGRATAHLFAREGAVLVVTDIREAAGPALVDELTAAGANAHFHTHDVSDEAAWAALAAAIRIEQGRLDVLVNNAGVGLTGPVTDLSLADWRRVNAINVEGTFLGTKHCLPLLRDSGGGSIVNVSSIAGIRPSAYASAYAASKGAVRLFTKAVALECAAAGDGVRVNSVHPGIVETAIWDDMIGTRPPEDGGPTRGEVLDRLVAGSIPLGRTGTPEEIAEAILWLAGDESRYVTGTELVIDGGRTLA